MKRTRIKIVGQSGSGLLSVGELVASALQSLGFWSVSDREYPSLIKGGHSCYTINISDVPIFSLSEKADILMALDKHSLVAYHSQLKKEGILVHGYERVAGIKDIIAAAKEKDVTIVSAPARTLAQKNGGNPLMANMILLGMLWKTFGFDLSILEPFVTEKFHKKKALFPIIKQCLQVGFDEVDAQINLVPLTQSPSKKRLDGNHAVALGAMHAGVRFYPAYPMSPASSILKHLAEDGPKIGMVVKQAEDEITAAQLALGAMTAGTRSFTATSGGGFDLMTETLSLSGIIESPFVVVLAQRPGPGTGLPTWTAQGDLNLALSAGHGEYPRVVVGVSCPEDAFRLTQEAFNSAEKYQVPVIILTEKVVCESTMTVPPFEQGKIPIERGLTDPQTVTSDDRYAMTDSGVSPRWLPGTSEAYYFANGDEHNSKGVVDESETAGDMYAKRMRKLKTIHKDIPEPIVYGPQKADISFIGWGSAANTLRDIVAEGIDGKTVNYIHYEYVWPLHTTKLKTFIQKNPNIHLIENNYTGQFGNLIEAEMGKFLKGRLLKWNGRPFFVEDVRTYIETNEDSLKI